MRPPEKGSRRRGGSWLPEPTQSRKSPARISSDPPLSLIHLSADFGVPRPGHQISDLTARPSRLLQPLAASSRLLQAPPGCGVPYSRRQGTLPTDPQGASNIPLQHESLPTAADWPEAAPAGGSLAAWKPGLAWRQVRAISRSLCCFLVSHPGLFTWSRLVGHF